jgi:RNA polymerase sigma-70 factor (ECF subfamily)
MAENRQSKQASGSRPDDFVRLFVAHERRILSFICTLVPRLADAEDIAQEVSGVLWEKFAEFRPGSDFSAWAFRIAQLKVLEFRRRERRGRLLFSDELLEQLASDATAESQRMERQQLALDDCLSQLSEPHRRLLQARYRPGGTLIEAAKLASRSVVTARKLLRSLHATLLDCVTRTLDQEGNG